MATRFIPTVERESIDLVYAFSNSYVVMTELTDGHGRSDRNVAGQHLFFSQYINTDSLPQSGIRSFFMSEVFSGVLPTNLNWMLSRSYGKAPLR